MKVRKCDFSFTLRTVYSYRRIQCCQRHTHIAGMNCNTCIAGAENGMHAIVSMQCSAPASRLSLITGHRSIIKISAPGTLHHVTSKGCHVSQLGGSTSFQSHRQQRITIPDNLVLGEVGVDYKGPD